jgi:putative ABC transport system ATP-binding protein
MTASLDHAMLMIEISQLGKTMSQGRRSLRILDGIDLSVPRGQCAAIVGASGSGKSTLLGLIAGLDAPTSGSIRIDGDEITTLSEDQLAQLRGRKIGFVFQSYQLIPTLTAEENVLLPHELLGLSASAGRERARALLAQVGLGQRLDHYPVQLSGGEQQRVALARAFMTRPPLLLADEPTGNLDSHTGAQVLELLLELNRGEGATLVLVTHDAQLARQADRVIQLQDGRITGDQLQLASAGA